MRASHLYDVLWVYGLQLAQTGEVKDLSLHKNVHAEQEGDQTQKENKSSEGIVETEGECSIDWIKDHSHSILVDCIVGLGCTSRTVPSCSSANLARRIANITPADTNIFAEEEESSQYEGSTEIERSGGEAGRSDQPNRADRRVYHQIVGDVSEQDKARCAIHVGRRGGAEAKGGGEGESGGRDEHRVRCSSCGTVSEDHGRGREADERREQLKQERLARKRLQEERTQNFEEKKRKISELISPHSQKENRRQQALTDSNDADVIQFIEAEKM
ncbi:hypothetical protein BLNAU_21604 [Blattamonas nauphoetae]|uniref:Uncharacterized protein n=1 Tax=Blattamonas nauphoetae TaxID=2049346 RepID=A0ABQ9WVV9_9EUKA|nr:hypothetical protein BLNAU_21604 [Blattamonas nauphoetae]